MYSNKLVEFMADETPFAVCVVEGSEYGTVYKISWSTKQPDHFVLHRPEGGDLFAVAHKQDSNFKFYHVEKLRKPEKKTVYVVTRSDGVRKEFSRAYDAVQPGAVDEHVLTDRHTCVSMALERIMYDIELAGLADTDFYRSLDNLSVYISASGDTLLDFWKQYADKGSEHHYCEIDTWGESYLGVLKYMANVYGWKVEEEERYE